MPDRPSAIIAISRIFLKLQRNTEAIRSLEKAVTVRALVIHRCVIELADHVASFRCSLTNPRDPHRLVTSRRVETLQQTISEHPRLENSRQPWRRYCFSLATILVMT